MFKSKLVQRLSKIDMVFTRVRLNFTDVLCICVLVALFVKTLIQRWRHRKQYAFMASIPGPIAFPLIGANYLALGITMSNVCGRLKSFVKHYPKIGGYWDGEEPHLITGDRETFNAILSSQQNIDKFRHYEHFKVQNTTNVVNGIFVSSGDDWRLIRKMINPCFRTKILTTFDENFFYHVNIFVDQLEQHVNGDAFDVFLPVHLCTMDLICDNMIHSRMDVQKKNLAYLSHSMTRHAEMLFERAFSPLLWSDLVYKLVGKWKLHNEYLTKEFNFLEEILTRRIEERDKFKATTSAAEGEGTFIDVLLENLDLKIITRDRVFSEIMDMFVAGSITTALTNSWVFKLLAMFPEIQERAYQEIIENCTDGKVTPNDLPKLVYLEMTIKETLRHFSVPVTGRRITEDLKVNEELTIPAGIQVFLCAYTLHHDPQYWQKPGEFYPEHFSPANEASRPKGAYVPFLSGPRACPGKTYAMRSIKFLVANTLLRFKFSTDERPPPDVRDLDYRLIFMIWPTSGYNVKISKR